MLARIIRSVKPEFLTGDVFDIYHQVDNRIYYDPIDWFFEEDIEKFDPPELSNFPIGSTLRVCNINHRRYGVIGKLDMCYDSSCLIEDKYGIKFRIASWSCQLKHDKCVCNFYEREAYGCTCGRIVG